MAIKIPGKGLDRRVEQILNDPKAYLANARKIARAQVEAEREQERGRFRHRPA